MKRDMVLLATLCNQPNGEPRPEDQSSFPNLGLLELASCIVAQAQKVKLNVHIAYYDGSVFGNDRLRTFLRLHHQRVAVVGFSCFTQNFESCLEFAKSIRLLDPDIKICLGNDHFSVLSEEILSQHHDCIDFGFRGNDVVESFASLAIDQLRGFQLHLETYPGLVWRRGPRVVCNSEEPVSMDNRVPIDYSLMDTLIEDTSDRYVARQGAQTLFMRQCGYRGTSVNIARGCLKYRKRGLDDWAHPSNTCDFCSLFAGQPAVSSMSPPRAWEAIRNAFEQGYNYLYITADEFPLTFWPLIRAMVETRPPWYTDLPETMRPKLFVDIRGDAFANGRTSRLETLHAGLNVDHVFMGIDAFTLESVLATNKYFSTSPEHYLAACKEACDAITVCGMRLTVGSVINHMGTTKTILDKSLNEIANFLQRYSSSLVQFDFAILIPMPGSLAFDCLVMPDIATQRARELGVDIDHDYLRVTSNKYRKQTVFNDEELRRDFVKACSPHVTYELLIEHMKKLRDLVGRYELYYNCDALDY
jgi:anaerobic magnesium-protoporphyrin IX monomethyl ester cyclase